LVVKIVLIFAYTGMMTTIMGRSTSCWNAV